MVEVKRDMEWLADLLMASCALEDGQKPKVLEWLRAEIGVLQPCYYQVILPQLITRFEQSYLGEQ